MRTRPLAPLALFAAAATVLVGCSTPSLTPLYSAERREVVAEPGIVGSWKNADDKTDEGIVYSISRASDPPVAERGNPAPEDRPTYTLVARKVGEAADAARFDVHIVRLGDHLFADVYPQTDHAKVAENYGLTYLPAHVPLRFTLKGDTLTMWQTDVSAVSHRLKEEPGLCPHAWVEDVAVLTGSPRQVQSFFLALADRPDMWEDPAQLKRVATPAK